MRAYNIILTILLHVVIANMVLADGPLSQEETLKIIERLTEKPYKTWIESGVIEADHRVIHYPQMSDSAEVDHKVKEAFAIYDNDSNKHELTKRLQWVKRNSIAFNTRYKYLNEYRMNSKAKVRYDGERFIWEIEVLSRVDSIKPSSKNVMAKTFKMKWNARRVFAWDGEMYTTYFQSANQAMVTEVVDNITPAVNGPLTAGIIPWGYGVYGYERLKDFKLDAQELTVDQELLVQLVVQRDNDIIMTFVLDPKKDYLVLDYSLTNTGKYQVDISYDEHSYVNGRWVPGQINIFESDLSTQSPRILKEEVWVITKVDNLAANEDFQVDYNRDAIIEHQTQLLPGTSFKYRYTGPENGISIAPLLYQRAAVLVSHNSDLHNCATVAIKHAASEFDVLMDDQKLSALVNPKDKSSSLYDLCQYGRAVGLHCQAVKCDINTLANLSGCQIILHLPQSNHFVVFGNLDNHYVRLIDLASNRLLYRQEKAEFLSQWSGGVALIIKDSPINLPKGCSVLSDSDMRTIYGADDCTYGCFACTELLQNGGTESCPDQVMPGICSGEYKMFYPRRGCKQLSGSGTSSCIGEEMPRNIGSHCVRNVADEAVCELSGDWTSYAMRACD